ncbi:hypothetical protein CWI84_07995 [Idiomarina tyrosinivorans]|uniref:Signaling protein n=1 Tax=Idiomarina tyrosinivorans TaxID=1445662 RepID=A0A432ZPS1_9GAMM|nr:EAL domain-containing protein [Idiomarina tyrosinivorans]RUO79894.1 hypothetical protein CWI84_07995 [Idiomarina tyrosinivorans]
MFRWMLAIALGLWMATVQAQAEPKIITLSSNSTKLELNSQLQFRLTSPQATIQTVLQNNDTAWLTASAFQDQHYAGETPMVWARVQIFQRIEHNRTYLLEIDQPYISRASVYIIGNNGELRYVEHTGADVPLLQRPFPNYKLIIPLRLQPNQVDTVFVAFQQWPQHLPKLTLWQPSSFQLHDQRQQILLGINAGTLFILSVIALVAAILLRNRILSAFTCVAAATMVTLTFHSGIGITYLAAEHPGFVAERLPLVMQLLLVTMYWYVAEILKARIGRRWLTRIAQWGTVISVLLLLASVWLTPHFSRVLAITEATFLLAFSVAAATSTRRRGQYRLQWLLWVVFSGLIASMTMPHFGSWWAGISGYLLYSVLTLLLALLLAALQGHRLRRLAQRIAVLKGQMRLYQRRYHDTLARSSEGWFSLTKQGQWKSANKRWLEMLGLERLAGLKCHYPAPFEVMGKAAKQAFQQRIAWNDLITIERFDGRKRWFDVHLHEDGKGHAVDVSARVEAETHLSYLSHHDALTGLLNRREFAKLVSQALEHKRRLSLVLLQIFDTDIIYQQRGAETRDQALLQLVLMIRQIIPSGAKIARLSDDEFAVLLNDDIQGAHALGYRLIQTVREYRYATAGRTYSLRANAGLTEATANTLHWDTLLREAKEALRVARQQGDFSLSSESQHAVAEQSKEIEHDWQQLLQNAAADESWQLYEQPIISLGEEDLWSFEVLLRLRSRRGELLAPHQFLPAAARSGVMARVDRWILRQVWEYASEQRMQQRRLHHIHVNISEQSVDDPEFIRFIETGLMSCHLKPQQLVIEINETIAASKFDDCYRLFSALQAFGVNTAIDQFGTGFQSFRLLKQLPLTMVKVNRFWVQDMLIDPLDAELVLTSIRVAQAANVKACAVGVEVDEVRARLRQTSVNYLQGFACGEPRPWQPVNEDFLRD